MDEVWRATHYEGYDVSSLGGARTYWIGRGARRRLAEQPRLIPTAPNFYGYPTASVAGRSILVHSLVLNAFVGPCPPGMEALHLNNDRSDARLANLRWGTPQENQRMRVAAGTDPAGERNGRAKITAEVVLRIRASAESNTLLAVRYGINHSTVSNIRARRTWRHI